MEYKSSRYLMICRGLWAFVGAICFVVLFGFLALSAYTVYDGLVVNREPAEVDELREQISEQPEAFQWSDGMVAWLRIDGTHIDYPVMQGSDNKWYLTHDYLGRWAISGSAFLDYRNAADLSDGLSIIYGHRMNGDLMFSDVAKYSDIKYFAEHLDGSLRTPNGEYKLSAIKHSILSAEDEVYGELSMASLGLKLSKKYLLLSTCNRSGKMKRDVLIMEIKNMVF